MAYRGYEINEAEFHDQWTINLKYIYLSWYYIPDLVVYVMLFLDRGYRKQINCWARSSLNSYDRHRDFVNCVTNEHGYFPYVVITIWTFPRSCSWLNTAFLATNTMGAINKAEAVYTSVTHEFIRLHIRYTWVHTRFLVGFVLFNL